MLKNVKCPSVSGLIKMTLSTVVFTGISAVVIYGVDAGFSEVVDAVLTVFGL